MTDTEVDEFFDGIGELIPAETIDEMLPFMVGGAAIDEPLSETESRYIDTLHQHTSSASSEDLGLLVSQLAAHLYPSFGDRLVFTVHGVPQSHGYVAEPSVDEGLHIYGPRVARANVDRYRNHLHQELAAAVDRTKEVDGMFHHQPLLAYSRLVTELFLQASYDLPFRERLSTDPDLDDEMLLGEYARIVGGLIGGYTAFYVADADRNPRRWVESVQDWIKQDPLVRISYRDEEEMEFYSDDEPEPWKAEERPALPSYVDVATERMYGVSKSLLCLPEPEVVLREYAGLLPPDLPRVKHNPVIS